MAFHHNNVANLAHQIENAGWKDPRFITFAQAKKLGYYLKPGQHASRVVYKEPKQKVFKLEGEELKAAQANNKPEEKTVNFFVNKTFLVFNAIKVLKITVEVGFVVGITAAITPIGSANFFIP